MHLVKEICPFVVVFFIKDQCRYAWDTRVQYEVNINRLSWPISVYNNAVIFTFLTLFFSHKGRILEDFFHLEFAGIPEGLSSSLWGISACIN